MVGEEEMQSYLSSSPGRWAAPGWSRAEWESGGRIRTRHSNTSERRWRLRRGGWRRGGEKRSRAGCILKGDAARGSPIFSVSSPILLILGFTKCYCLHGPFPMSQPQIQSVSKYCYESVLQFVEKGSKTHLLVEEIFQKFVSYCVSSF